MTARAKILFVAPVSVCGPGIDGGQQRTNIIFDGLAKNFDVDVALVGTWVNDTQQAYFKNASKIFKVLHLAPGARGGWKVLRSFLPRQIVDKVASTVTPRIKGYSPDEGVERTAGEYQFIRL